MSHSNCPNPGVVLCLAKNQPSQLSAQSPGWRRAASLAGALLLIVVVTASTVSAQGTLSLLGTNTPAVVESKDSKSVVLGVKVFSDVAGTVLGCSFYKAPANTGVHVVSRWDATGKLLATQTATGETASGKQSVLFASPVQIAAKQTVTCGYFAPQGHYSYDRYAFTVQKDAAPLHIPINGGVAVYSSQATTFPTTAFQASSYWVDVLFAPPSSATWISGPMWSQLRTERTSHGLPPYPTPRKLNTDPLRLTGTLPSWPQPPGGQALRHSVRLAGRNLSLPCAIKRSRCGVGGWSRLHPCPVASGESLRVALERERRLGPSPAVDGNREQYPEPIGRMGRQRQERSVRQGCSRLQP